MTVMLKEVVMEMSAVEECGAPSGQMMVCVCSPPYHMELMEKISQDLQSAVVFDQSRTCVGISGHSSVKSDRLDPSQKQTIHLACMFPHLENTWNSAGNLQQCVYVSSLRETKWLFKCLHFFWESIDRGEKL